MLRFRSFDYSDKDYASLVAITNSESDTPRSVEELKVMDSMRKKDKPYVREFVEVDGEVAGVVSCLEHFLTEEPGGYYIGLSLYPEFRDRGHEIELYRYLIEQAERNAARSVTANSRDDRIVRVQALEELGFRLTMRDPVTVLDLTQFDPTPFDRTLRKVKESGIVIKTVAELEAEGVDWLPLSYELSWELLQDVPLPHPPKKMSFEDYTKWVRRPIYWFPQGWVVAMDGDQWVGSSDLQPTHADATVAMTGLTGVVRSHRRRGIATALKVTALGRAREAGVKTVKTGNEENNPMLQLNFQLGFRQTMAMLVYRKDF